MLILYGPVWILPHWQVAGIEGATLPAPGMLVDALDMAIAGPGNTGSPDPLEWLVLVAHGVDTLKGTGFGFTGDLSDIFDWC